MSLYAIGDLHLHYPPTNRKRLIRNPDRSAPENVERYEVGALCWQ